MKNQSTESAKLSVKTIRENDYEISLAYQDFLGLFSIVAGLFSSCRFNIIRGTVSTSKDSGRNKRVEIVLEVEVKETPNWQALESDLDRLFKKAKQGELDEARKELNTRIVHFFRTHEESYLDKLYPIELNIRQDLSTTETVVDLKTQDTMAFLYELTSALSSLEINITRMEIETKDRLVQDRIWLTSGSGEKITSERKLKELRWAILLVRQFTHLLPKVPDPLVALDQMASFGKEIFGREDFDDMLLALEETEILKRLSKIFGTSRFLWEEFIRTQHTSLIPLLEDQATQKKKSKAAMKRELVKKIRGGKDFQQKVEALNHYKDHEMFRIDLRHLLWKASYLEEFAEEFSDLCEVVVEAGYHLAWDKLTKTMPLPMTSSKNQSELSILALGKFGGRELGYASDLELLFVYTDSSDTADEFAQKNLEFYSELVRLFRAIIWARSEGVFEIDLRLRPHGKNGPIAVSLELFKQYYSEKGEAWSFERQALVKLRPVAGSPWLGKEIERLRDEFVYGSQPFNFEEALTLRERQRTELVKPGTVNAKFSTGGLLDIEYLVQMLQIVFGRMDRALRKTNTFQAMRALWQNGVLEENEFQSLRASYFFIRDLINALRIFRGNAKDLTVPNKEELEFTILGRRMGYEGNDEEVKNKLEKAYLHHMEVAAGFYRAWMEKLRTTLWEAIAQIKVRSPQSFRVSLDELLRGDLSELSEKNLFSIGFLKIPEMTARVKRLFPGTLIFEPFAKTFDLMWPIWPKVPDPDLALTHLERMAENIQDKATFWQFLSDSEENLAWLLRLFGSSRYLSEIMIANPICWKWIFQNDELALETVAESLKSFETDKQQFSSEEKRLDSLRKLRHQETLRIALVEMMGNEKLDAVFRTFTELSDFILQKIFSSGNLSKEFCVIGLGKLGGEELNFSSDIDLMFVSKVLESKRESDLIEHLQKSLHALTHGTKEGFLYRVDLRLRPHGNAGALVMTNADSLHYYKEAAEAWEHQMLIKARSVAGERSIGDALIASVSPLIYDQEWKGERFERLREMKRRYEAQVRSRGEEAKNIKMGIGGIRDVEFSVQALQLFHAKRLPELKSANTLQALSMIEKLELLSEEDCQTLRDGYIFLRRIENRLQLYDNRQTFLIPSHKQGVRGLAKSLGFSDSTHVKAEDQFQSVLGQTMEKCREIFEQVFFG